MGLLDYNNRLTPTAQQFNATAVATNTHVLGATGEDFGNGEPMAMVFTVTVAGAKAGTEAYTFQAVSSTASNGTSGQVILAQSGVYTASSGTFDQRSQLAVGDQIVIPIPVGVVPATATHLTAKVVIASSGDITGFWDLVPLHQVTRNKSYTAQPTLQ